MLNVKIIRYCLQNNNYFCKVRKWFVIVIPNLMDLNATIDIIIKDLNEIREIIDDLKRYPGVPSLQIELAKSKCKSAAEVVALFKEAGVLSGVSEPHEIREEKAGTEDTRMLNEEMFEVVRHADQVGDDHKDVVEIPGEVIRESSKASLNLSQTVIKTEPLRTVKRSKEAAIIADQFDNRGSFNEKLGSMIHEEDISEIMKTKPVSSLPEAIGINDKFLFIREIFNGDQDSYNNAINKLDRAGNLNDAKSIVETYTSDITDNDAVKQLMDLLKRKFHSDE